MTNLLGRRILVTGGAGFLGSHLCAKLIAAGHEVLCVDNFYTGRRTNLAPLLQHPALEVMRHDICFPLYVEVDEFYNLACPASPVHYQFDPVQTTKTSVHGSINMLGLAKRIKAKILQASTSEVYGDPQVHPQDGRVISNFIVQALQGEDLTVYGDGGQTRSFCYVDDLIDGLIAFMQSADEVVGPVNLGNPGEYTIREVAEMVLKLTGGRSSIVFKPLPQDDPTQRQPDITLARHALGWEPKVPLAEGLERTVAYFKTLLHTDNRT